MTVGSPVRLIFGFFFPLLFGLLFQQLYNMVDSVVVGRYLGVSALAGVGSTGSVSFLVLGFCIGVCNGFVIPVAQKYGEHDYKGLKQFVVNAIMLSIVFAVVMTVIVCLLCQQILVWMNTPTDVLGYAYDYIFVIFLGIPVVFLYNVLFGVIRSLGDSRTPVMYLVFCSVLNVVLDLLFILVFHMGVAGAGWATILSQAISALLCVRYIWHCDMLIFNKSDWRFDRDCVKKLIGMGLPTGLQYSITAIGSIVLQVAVNSLGSVAVASVAAASKVNQLVCCPFDAMGSTMATYGGQNVGARNLDRIRQGFRSCSMLNYAYAIIAWVVLFFGGRLLSQMFVNASEKEVLDNSALFLKWAASFYIPLGFVNILRFLIQGLGFTRQAVYAGVCEMIARTAVAFALVPVLGYTAVCFAHPAAWVAADLYLFPMYFIAMKRLTKRFALKPAD